MKQSIAELRAGLRKAEAEINVARGMAGSSSSAGLMEDFATAMSAFHESAAASLKSTEVGQKLHCRASTSIMVLLWV